MTFYCYVYYDETWQAVYVGKGCGLRAFSRTDNVPVPDQDHIQTFHFDEEWQAYECEIELISFWKRESDGGTLMNKSLGGPGCPGYQHSLEHRERMSALFTGRKLTDEAKEKISQANSNPSMETRLKMSFAKKGRKISSETRRKMAKAHTGKKHSDESKKKMSDARKAWWKNKNNGIG